jgi:hypothetical protein
LDASVLVSNLPEELLNITESLVVKIWDDQSSVMYRYDTFMSKAYKVEDGYIRLGVKRLKLAGMILVVGVRIECEELESLIDPPD